MSKVDHSMKMEKSVSNGGAMSAEAAGSFVGAWWGIAVRCHKS